jgi:hypothetical protein
MTPWQLEKERREKERQERERQEQERQDRWEQERWEWEQQRLADTVTFSVGEWTWTNCGEDECPALQLPDGWTIRSGDDIDAAYLAEQGRDLAELAGLVAKHEAGRDK